MITVLAPVADLLTQGAAAVRDTVIMKQVAADRGVFDRIAEIASALIALALLTLTVVAIPVAFHSRRTYRKVTSAARSGVRRRHADHAARATDHRQRQLHHDVDPDRRGRR